MHKPFYASGFLYSLSSEQILLQQDNTLPSVWSFFGQNGQSNENPLNIFQKAIFQQLHINLNLELIYPIYDYFNNELEKTCYVFYAQVVQEEEVLHTRTNYNAEWFTFKQTKKLLLPDQIKQDIIVGERVIKAKARNDEIVTLSLGATH